MRARLTAIAALALTSSVPSIASAFCGFYVAGAGAELFANATMVVLMRSGQTTALSMQNDYEGPPEEFALVIPVPTVLEEENVRTLPTDVFASVERLSAPRLVEYWEQDPCDPAAGLRAEALAMQQRLSSMRAGASPPGAVVVEAEFAVGEYDIVILSASQSGALDNWLVRHGYNIPAGAADVLRPYVEAG